MVRVCFPCGWVIWWVADAEIAKQLAMSSDLGGWATLQMSQPAGSYTHQPPLTHTLTADEATRKDLAVKKDTVTPSWWAIRKLFKVCGSASGMGSWGARA